ncbi:hypothetical protein GCM10010377_20470 [Streptomyces viridiviolaceus]|nr:hypothetical protein GCM10010377_20470 [Streptomyces viridiviolaceus]
MWGSTGRVPLSTCETVATETPALRATSAIVANGFPPSLVPPTAEGRPAGTVSHSEARVNACASVYVLATHPPGRSRPPDIVALHTP